MRSESALSTSAGSQRCDRAVASTSGAAEIKKELKSKLPEGDEAAAEKLGVVVTFLALLELIKQEMKTAQTTVLPASALGKAMLAYSPEHAVADLLAEPLPRLTSRTLTPAALRDELNDVRERGFAREKDEAILGESSIASPIFDHSGHAVGAIGIVGDTDRIMPRGPAKQLTSAVAEAARGVSRELGASRWPARSPDIEPLRARS